MTPTIPETTDGTSGYENQPTYKRGDKLVVIATGDEVIYWVTLSTGEVEVVDKGKIRHFEPDEVRLADEPVPSSEQVKAREFAAGLAEVGEFFIANPHLMKHFPPHARHLATYIWGPNARAAIEEFIAAGQGTAGAELAEYEDTHHGGVDVRFPGGFVRVYTAHKYLADEQPAPKPAYRPLLGDDAGAGA